MENIILKKENIFIGIPIPYDFHSTLTTLLKDNINQINLVRLENLHITLRFFGKISDEFIEDLKQFVSSFVFNTFSVTLSKISIWKSNLLVIEVDSEYLIRLKKEIDLALNNRFNLLFEHDFKPHITIGTIVKGFDLELFQNMNVIIHKIKLDKLVLFQSDTTDKRVRIYRTLASSI